jgi:hypothetical protein
VMPPNARAPAVNTRGRGTFAPRQRLSEK